MPNLRIISDNAIDRATMTASSQASTKLSVVNLKSDDEKANVWRSAAGTSARVMAAWTTPELIGGIALIGNFSPATTARVRLTTELSASNLLAAPNDFTSGLWIKTGITPAAGVSGPDGANSATTLTATAANATITATVGVAAGNYASSVFIRRRTGAGTVSIRNTANTTWVPVTVTAAWTRVSNVSATGTSAVVGLQIATSGDAVDVCFAQLEANAVTSYYPGVRPLGYIDAWQSYAYDSGPQWACPAPAVELRGFTASQAASAYGFGGGAYARLWVPQIACYGLSVDISDPGNLQGYIEAVRMVAGKYWSPQRNPDWGTASVTPVDLGKNTRASSGMLLRAVGPRYRKMPMAISQMQPQDRTDLFNILRANGTGYPMLVSLFPEDADASLERDHMVWGCLSSVSATSIACWRGFSAPLEFEEV